MGIRMLKYSEIIVHSMINKNLPIGIFSGELNPVQKAIFDEMKEQQPFCLTIKNRKYEKK